MVKQNEFIEGTFTTVKTEKDIKYLADLGKWLNFET